MHVFGFRPGQYHCGQRVSTSAWIQRGQPEVLQGGGVVRLEVSEYACD